MTTRPARPATAAALLLAFGAFNATPAHAASLPRFRSNGPATFNSSLSRTAQSLAKHSWIDPAAAKGRLLYVSDPATGSVLVYTYPQLTGAGTISGFSNLGGLCTDKRGYIWILDTGDQVAWEYRHGGIVPIQVLHPGNPSNEPGVGKGCAVDPKSGDLAIASAGFGAVTVFRNGQNTQSIFGDGRMFQFNYVGYDGVGNLFVDGVLVSNFAFGLDELPRGANALQAATLTGGGPGAAGGIAWDGTYLDISDGAGMIFQTNGSMVLGSIDTNTGCMGQFYITGNHDRLVVPDPCNVGVDIEKYPAGGNPLKTVNGGMGSPISAAISVPAW